MKAKKETIEKFNKTVIEALYGIPFKDAIEDEPPCHYCIATGKIELFGDMVKCEDCNGTGHQIIITLSRVMQALDNNKICLDCVTGKSKYCKSGWHNFAENYEKYAYVINICNWKPTINNKTATSEDQEEETLLKLIEILK